MLRDRFQMLYHTVMHLGEANSASREKIEPLINMFVEKFQASFYPFEDLAIDEMVIG